MFSRFLLVALFVPTLCCAQHYRTVTLDAVFSEWDETTKTYSPGMSVMQPQKLKFSAKYVSGPQACSKRALEVIFRTLRKPELLDKIPINNCIKISSEAGREVTAWVQDVLVAGLNADAKVGGEIELHVDLLAYGVSSDRSRNMPFMLVNGFEPK